MERTITSLWKDCRIHRWLKPVALRLFFSLQVIKKKIYQFSELHTCIEKVNILSFTWETLILVGICCYSCSINTLGSPTHWRIWKIFHWPAVHWIWKSVYLRVFDLFDLRVIWFCDIISEKCNWPCCSRFWDSLCIKTVECQEIYFAISHYF